MTVFCVMLLAMLACAKADELLTPTPTNQPNSSQTPTITAVVIQSTPSAKPARVVDNPAIPSPPIMTCRVSTGLPDGWLNLRSEPGENAPIITVLTEGETLTITDASRADWLKVNSPSGSGWVYGPYCEVSK